jgi:hypothetical protein
MPSFRPFPRLALAVLAAVLGGVPAVAQTYDASTRTVTVAPSGVDDTRALRTAFDVCQAVGPGCTVQLEAGTFRTQQIEVWGFHGTFAGAGMDVTVVETLAPLPISPPDHDIARSFADPEGGPVLMAFRNAHMTMRDLTLRNDAPEPTTGWRFNDFPIPAIAVMLVLEGDDLRVDVERIAVESAPGVFDGLSALNGIWIQGIKESPEAPILETVGSVTIRNSRVDGPAGGVVVENVEGITVVVRDSQITAFEAVSIWNVGRSVIEIRGNDLAGRDRAVGVTSDPGGWRPQGPTTVLVTGNRLRTLGASDAVAVGIDDRGQTPTQFVIVERNVIEVDAAAAAAISGDGEGLVVRDNVVVGSAPNGVVVAGGVSATPMPWVVIGNDFTGFTARLADVTIATRARGAVVVCGLPTSVRDLGTGSLVACD